MNDNNNGSGQHNGTDTWTARGRHPRGGGYHRGGRGRGCGCGGPGGRGRGRGRGRGGRGFAPRPAEDAPIGYGEPSTMSTAAAAVDDEDVRASLPGAFHPAFPRVARVKDRARVFWVSTRGSTLTEVTGGPEERVFIVAERTVAGLDDLIYEKHRAVWEGLPRGNARVFALRDSDAGRRASLDEQLAALAKTEGEAKRRQHESVSLTMQDVECVGAVNGLRKFSYNDKPAGSKGQDYGYAEDVDAVIAMDKENGECGHVSAFTIPGPAGPERYWVLGSKNVHIVLPFRFSEADLTSGYRAKRYGYAVKIARQWGAVMALAEHHDMAGADGSTGDTSREDAIDIDKETFCHVTGEKLLRFHTVLAEKNYTACFEAIFRDSQHLVDYDGRNSFRFFALTDNATYEARGRSSENGDGVENGEANTNQWGRTIDRSANSFVHGLCVDIQQSFYFFTECGLPTASLYYGEDADATQAAAAAISTGTGTLPTTPFHSDAFTALIDAIGHRQNSEGCVMYGYKLDREGGRPARVVKVWKEKAYPYVMERATREAIVNHRLAGRALRAKIMKKMALQKPHIRRYFVGWERDRLPFLVLFSAYLQITGTLTPFMSKDESFMKIRNNWLSLQREFAARMESDYELRAVCERFVPGEHADNPALTADVDGPAGRLPPRSRMRMDVVKFVGAQGCGKSTLSRILFFLLAEAGQRPRWVNQDEAGGRANYLAAIRQACVDAATTAGDRATGGPAGVTHLMLDKMNLDARTNADYAQLPEPAVTVCFAYEGEFAGGAEGRREAHDGGLAHRQRAMTDLLLTRVLDRGSGHRTIRIPDSVTGDERRREQEKVRKFLSQAVRACEVPEDDDNLIFVDVTDSLETQVERIWAALCENGFHELPSLDTLHLETAIRVAQRYEEILTRQARPPVYACLAIPTSENAKLLAIVESVLGSEILRDMRVQTTFHVTTKYFVGDPDPLYLVALGDLEGLMIDVSLEAVAGDEKGVAIRVCNEAAPTPEAGERRYENDIIAHLLSTEHDTGASGESGVAAPRWAFPCANRIAHITIANYPGVPPKYSQQLLASTRGQPIPGGVTVKGVFTFK